MSKITPRKVADTLRRHGIEPLGSTRELCIGDVEIYKAIAALEVLLAQSEAARVKAEGRVEGLLHFLADTVKCESDGKVLWGDKEWERWHCPECGKRFATLDCTTPVACDCKLDIEVFKGIFEGTPPTSGAERIIALERLYAVCQEKDAALDRFNSWAAACRDPESCEQIADIAHRYTEAMNALKADTPPAEEEGPVYPDGGNNNEVQT